jgi:hypothetical protein
MQWQVLPIDPKDEKKAKLAIRLNALGSLYFHTKFVLQRNRLIDRLHLPIALSLESEHRQFLLEFPRDHFKSTLVGEGLLTWWALPFNEADEAAMRVFGYDDAWISWMKRAHNPHIRILTVSEILDNAQRMGIRIDQHYQNNNIFRAIFPEIIPTGTEKWNIDSKLQRVVGTRPHGEGTFDYIGVGGALQSRHYDKIIEDDLVGKDAWKSDTIMADTINYHVLLEGAFDGPQRVNYVVGNRWRPEDLNGWIRKNETGFTIETHGALGGCCERHPSGKSIFPEEFPIEELERIRKKQGPYIFASQYLNLPIAPEECIFKPEWLRFYGPTKAPNTYANSTPDPYTGSTERSWLRHEVNNGEVIGDLDPRALNITMVVDPNHAGANGRARHAIVVTGLYPDNGHVYLLDVWAESISYEHLVANIYKMAARWNLREFWLEVVAAQRYLKYHLEYRNRIENRKLTVMELKTSTGKDAKRIRIESMEPIIRDGRLWVRRDQSTFLEEYYAFPGGRTVDVLDCLGYAPQTWNAVYARSLNKVLEERKQKYTQRKGHTGY